MKRRKDLIKPNTSLNTTRVSPTKIVILKCELKPLLLVSEKNGVEKIPKQLLEIKNLHQN